MQPTWIEAMLLAIGFIDLLDLLSSVTMAATIVLLRQHQWRRQLASYYLATSAGILSRLGVFGPVTEFRLILLVLAAILVLVYPIACFPALSGIFPVSCITTRLSFVDIRLFFPSSSPDRNQSPVPYLEWEMHTPAGLAKFSKMPSILLSHLPSFRLRSYRQNTFHADLTGLCPVIIFSHGLGGTFETYSSLLEDWASQGFVVVAINHSDGSAAAFRRPEWQSRSDTELYVPLADDAPAMDQRSKQLKHRIQEVNTVVTDLLDGSDLPPEINSKIDKTRIFAVGHSFGASTALTAVSVDVRFKAAVALDLWVQPVPTDVFEKESRLGSVPVMHIVSSTWTTNECFSEFVSSVEDHSSGGIWEIQGAKHASFSDVGLYSPMVMRLLKLAPSTPTDAILKAASRLTADFLLEKFDQAELCREFPFLSKTK